MLSSRAGSGGGRGEPEGVSTGAQVPQKERGAGPALCGAPRGEEGAGSTLTPMPPAPPARGQEVEDGAVLRNSSLDIDGRSVSVLQ